MIKTDLLKTPPSGRTTTTTICTETCTRPRPRQRPQLPHLLHHQRARVRQQQLRPPVRPRPRPRLVLLPRLAMEETPPALHSFRKSLPARRCRLREGWSTTLESRGRRRCRPTRWRQRLPTNSTKGEADSPFLPISSSKRTSSLAPTAVLSAYPRDFLRRENDFLFSPALDTRTARRTRHMHLAPLEPLIMSLRAPCTRMPRSCVSPSTPLQTVCQSLSTLCSRTSLAAQTIEHKYCTFVSHRAV